MYKKLSLLIIGVFLLSFCLTGRLTQAEEANFKLQVSPSPIIETIKPGDSKSINIAITNQGKQAESLVMGLKSFDVSDDGQVNIKDDVSDEVSSAVIFSDNQFVLEAGAKFDQQMVVNLPEDAGFTFPFAVTISRLEAQNNPQSGANLRGSVAIFALITVDRPDAKRSFQINSFTSTKKLYSKTPVEFDLKLTNSGNTFVVPSGTLFVSTKSDFSDNLATIAINPSLGNILPQKSRTLDLSWDDNKSSWTSFKFGKHYAKVVAVYNDGQSEVPVEAVVSFWLVSWPVVILCLATLLLIIILIIFIRHKLSKNRE